MVKEFELRRAEQVVGYNHGESFDLIVVETQPGKFLETHASTDFLAMDEAHFAERGEHLKINSGWRSFEKQDGFYQTWKAWVKGGKQGRHVCRPCRPGYSKHHNGIAADINRGHDDPDGRGPLLSDTDKWLRANAHKYGYFCPFMAVEPWHWEHHPDRKEDDE